MGKVSHIDSIFSQFDDQGKPGAAVAVYQGGNIIFQKGYGSANLEYGIPVTPSTIFHVASVSKQFTAFAILLLAEAGKLNFEDDIRKYIPEVPDFGTKITLRHLASHTSGLRDQWNLLALAGWRLDDVITKEHIFKLIAKQKELNFEPGEEYLYCNTGFTLLAEVVARVSGMSFAEFTKTKIFDPLQMANTLFYDDHERIVQNRAYSYYAEQNDYKKSVLSFANVGATSLFTTVEDLGFWVENFHTKEVGNARIIKELNTLATLNNGDTFGGAYGQFINNYNGLKQIQHGGSDAGYRSYLGRFPDQHFGVAVFSNFAYSNPNNLALSLADLYLADLMKVEPPQTFIQPSFVTLSKESLRSFTGNYWNEAQSYSRKIYLKNDTLRYNRGDNNESIIVPINDHTFQMLGVGVDLKVSFEGEGEQKKMIVIIDEGEPIVSESYLPVDYSTQDLEAFTGEFHSEELSTSYQIVLKNGQLVATHSRLSDLVLQPIKKDVFTGSWWYFQNVKFEQNSEGDITGLRVSSGRVRNLYFKKRP